MKRFFFIYFLNMCSNILPLPYVYNSQSIRYVRPCREYNEFLKLSDILKIPTYYPMLQGNPSHPHLYQQINSHATVMDAGGLAYNKFIWFWLKIFSMQFANESFTMLLLYVCFSSVTTEFHSIFSNIFFVVLCCWVFFCHKGIMHFS